jgi:hypothetical protein
MDFEFTKMKKKNKFCLHVWIFLQLWNLSYVDLILDLKFATSKKCFSQFRLDSNWANWAFKRPYPLVFGLAPPFPPFALIQFNHYGDWTLIFLGKGKKLTTKPSLFQMMWHGFHLLHPYIAFMIFKFYGLFSTCFLWLLTPIGLFFRGGYMVETL